MIETLRIKVRIRNGCDFKSRDTVKTWDNRRFSKRVMGKLPLQQR